MLATAIIVFREVLEAALIVSVVMAAAKGVAGRNVWVTTGIVAGIIGAALVATFAGALSESLSGMGQEVFNASILLTAVVMLGWHNIWMSTHGREMAKDVGVVTAAVRSGARPLYALAIVTGVAVLREGSETVLFLYGIASSGGGGGAPAMLTGGALGVLAGVGVGAGLYFGLLRIPMRHLFTVTNWMILLLAAGMASQAAGFLMQANLLPSLGSVWDSSWLLTENSVPGRILHTLVGYASHPAGVQVLFYLATLLTIGILTQVVGKTNNPKPTTSNQKAPAQ